MNVVVVGGGIAGVTAALNLAQRGYQVLLVERAPNLGGNASTVCCKALNGQCQLCGACLLADNLAAVRLQPKVAIRTQTTVTHVQRANGGFALALSPAAGEPIHAQAVILATGFDHIDAHTKGPYGYGILPAVTTGEEMERRIKEHGQAAYDTLPLRKVAFIQCVGSRDEHAGRGYCSQVCCRYAVRLARLLKSRIPSVQATIFKMDIQTCGRDFAAAWAAANNEGIRIVSGLPAVIRRSASTSEAVTFLYDDILAGKIVQEDFNLVVLAVGMQPRRDADDVAELWGVNQDPSGFFAAISGPVGGETNTLVPGVFVAGSCQAPRTIAESIAHAQQAAEACALYLQEKGS